MDSYFDVLVLAALFVPVALMVAANLAAYRSPDTAEGLLGALACGPLAGPRPASAPRDEAQEMPELRRAA